MSRARPKKNPPGARIPDPRFGRFCIGCSCCDTFGCEAGCSWRVAHPSIPVGVCSECPAYLPLLAKLDVVTARAIYRELAAKATEWI